MKILLAKSVGPHKMNFEELTTVLSEAEAVMNSRPLMPMDSSPTDGVQVLTPGHFLIGRPLCSLPEKFDSGNVISAHKRWNLCQLLTAELWRRWSREYICSLNRDVKTRRLQRDIQPGDIVLLKEVVSPQRSWPLARVLETHPRPDGHARVATIKTEKAIYKRPIVKLVLLLEDEDLHLKEKPFASTRRRLCSCA